MDKDSRSLDELMEAGSGVSAPASLVSLYRRAFKEFGTQSLWNRREIEAPTITAVLVIADCLRREGSMKCRPLIAEIEAACRAALPVNGRQIIRTAAGEEKAGKSIALTDLWAFVDQRKAELGIVETPERTEALRNKGLDRTPAKRDLLRRSRERAIAAGVDPIKANF